MALDDGVFAQHETTIRHFQAWLAFYQESQDDELVKQVCQHVFSIPGIRLTHRRDNCAHCDYRIWSPSSRIIIAAGLDQQHSARARYVRLAAQHGHRCRHQSNHHPRAVLQPTDDVVVVTDAMVESETPFDYIKARCFSEVVRSEFAGSSQGWAHGLVDRY